MNNMTPIKAKDAASVNGYVYIRLRGEMQRVVMLTKRENGLCVLNVEGKSYTVEGNHTLWYTEAGDHE